MLGEGKKIPADEFLVFYNNVISPDRAVESTGDDTTGGSSDGDDETLKVETVIDSEGPCILPTCEMRSVRSGCDPRSISTASQLKLAVLQPKRLPST